MLLRRSELPHGAFVALLECLLGQIVFVKDEVLDPHIHSAEQIVEGIDPDDAAFIACCLAVPGSVLWSDDKRLKGQTAVTVLNTREITAMLSIQEDDDATGSNRV